MPERENDLVATPHADRGAARHSNRLAGILSHHEFSITLPGGHPVCQTFVSCIRTNLLRIVLFFVNMLPGSRHSRSDFCSKALDHFIHAATEFFQIAGHADLTLLHDVSSLIVT